MMGDRDEKRLRANPQYQANIKMEEGLVSRVSCLVSRVSCLGLPSPLYRPINAVTRIARSARSEAIASELARSISTEASDSEQRRNAARG
jgi:hypothetical protein